MIRLNLRNSRILSLCAIGLLWQWIPLGRKATRKLRHSIIHDHNCSNEDTLELEREISQVVGIPDPPRILIFYYKVSMIIHILNVINNATIVFHIDRLIWANNSLACHLPRTILLLPLGQDYINSVSLMISLFHIVVKLTLIITGKDFDLEVITYLLWCDKNTGTIDRNSIKFKIIKDLRRAMCSFEFIDKFRTKSIHRPNRFNDNQTKLTNIILWRTGVAIAVFLATSLSMAPLTIWSVYSNQQSHYGVDCDFTSYNASFWIRFTSSVLMSSFQFFENYISVALVLIIVSISLDDLMLYWYVIESSLKKLRYNMPVYRAQYTKSGQRYVGYKKSIGSTKSQSRMDWMLEKTLIDDEILDLQMLIGDFFNRLRHLDRYISVSLFVQLSIWFGFNGLFCLIGIQHKSTSTRVLQFLDAVYIFCVNGYCLTVQVSTKAAYNLICSIMALDPTGNKQKWHSILENYTGRPSYGFKIMFNENVLTKLSLLKLITVTCSFISAVEFLVNERAGS